MPRSLEEGCSESTLATLTKDFPPTAVAKVARKLPFLCKRLCVWGGIQAQQLHWLKLDLLLFAAATGFDSYQPKQLD